MTKRKIYLLIQSALCVLIALLLAVSAVRIFVETRNLRLRPAARMTSPIPLRSVQNTERLPGPLPSLFCA